MPGKRYVVTLTAAERSSLQALVAKGKAAARKRLHAGPASPNGSTTNTSATARPTCS